MTSQRDSRPDPDALLSRVRADEQREHRAKLKVFFGFAPGVGKTYRMLQVAQSLAEQGRDVLVGMVETHGRKETMELAEGLALLPRREISYRGKTIEELDLDAALRRKPSLLLVDELAHTNAPGSRHPKRWQDVVELLDAGIDVMTTLNVQHVESLNDVVAQITHVQVRETIPDSILDRADEIELVDLPPDELLLRLKEGKVYLGDAAARAAEHFFRRGNLLALRELALRRTAERVDADVLAYRHQHGVDSTWATAERILVCVGPAPASARLVRAARRMAAGLRAPWVAAYVDAPGRAPLLPRDSERLETHLQLAASLGATVARLSGVRASEAILAHARKHNVTRILIGKPTHSRLRDLLRGSMLDEIVRGSGDIDVHVISGDVAETQRGAAPAAEAEERRPASLLPYVWALLLVGVTTAIAAAAHHTLGIPDVEMLYLLAIMITAASLGRGPSIAAAVASVAAFDFVFVPPSFTLAVQDGRYVLTFAMMFGVGIVLSSLVVRIRHQERDALHREERTAALFALSRDLATAVDVAQVARATAARAADVFGSPASVSAMVDGQMVELSRTPTGGAGARDDGVARWVLEHGSIAGLGTDTLPGSSVVCTPLKVASEPLAVLSLEPPARTALLRDQLGFLEVFARQAAFALERVHLADEARRAALRAKSEELRSALLSTVSHDLRTPLAAITGAATTLRDESSLAGASRVELVEMICEEADRMERLVTNLLDMTRLDSGAVELRKEWLPLVEVVGSTMTHLEPRLRAHRVAVSLPDELPMVLLDPVLAERLFANLMENAAKHTPPGSTIDVSARMEDGAVVIEVGDDGPGIPAGDEERIFERFYRPAGSRTEGVGLGLAICRAIAEAHGARLQAGNKAGGGAFFRLRLPVGETPPEPPSATDPGAATSQRERASSSPDPVSS
jgi:two-component system sensor histidine kinase KdpD